MFGIVILERGVCMYMCIYIYVYVYVYVYTCIQVYSLS